MERRCFSLSWDTHEERIFYPSGKPGRHASPNFSQPRRQASHNLMKLASTRIRLPTFNQQEEAVRMEDEEKQEGRIIKQMVADLEAKVNEVRVLQI